ncbi:MAG: von Willebrand factor type A domain-containing protein [Phycisphaerae bacterium]|nr:von Willebrand factor type A domain-containing protein [Phycisphaerae bacterium]
MTIDPNDPRLTAYALGELDGAEREAFECLLESDPAARALVDDLRRTADVLERALAEEGQVALAPSQREEIAAASEARDLGHRAARPRRLYRVMIPSALAASILLAAFVGYMMLPRLGRARESSEKAKKLAAARLSQQDMRLQSEVTAPVQRIRKRNLTPYAGIGGSSVHAEVNPGNESESLVGAGVVGGDPPGTTAAPRNEALTSTRAVAASLHFETYDNISYGYHTPSSDKKSTTVPLDNRSIILSGESPWLEIERASGEDYQSLPENPFLTLDQQPVSTFSIDVDTASYANVRRFLTKGMLPPTPAVRIEELINYFHYDYPPPTGDEPFSVNVEFAECPWNAEHRLARIGLKGKVFPEDTRPSANVVFLIDVSGSMQPANKLPLLIEGMKMMVEELYDDDRVAIVVYAGSSGLVLPSTPGYQQGAIRAALDGLRAGGSTNAGEGIELAYDTALNNYIEGGANRVILATDGDFNVGVTNRAELEALITDRARDGVFLTVLGLGMGNLKDGMLEMLADKGNGNYAYIDSLDEARKVLVDQMGGTLVTIAKDVKIQVEFNPDEVVGYRLVGYENRMLQTEDFDDDTKDAGEIGAGHTVTALYELIPASPLTESVGEETFEPNFAATMNGAAMTVRLRYKDPDGDISRLIEFPAYDTGLTLDDASDDFVFAAAVASFGMLLRHSQYADLIDFPFVAELAGTAMGYDPDGYRAEFVDLVRKADALQRRR